MGFLRFQNDFPVDGRVVLITGGSRGMGLEVGRQLAAKGAHIVIVARDLKKLEEACIFIQKAVTDPLIQRVHHISADLVYPGEAVRVMKETVAWNFGHPPDIVWCCAGSAYPTLFAKTPLEQFRAMMDSNYFTAVYMAHAAMRAWLLSTHETIHGTVPACNTIDNHRTARSEGSPARHLIFTASFLSLYPLAGYSAYSPSKAALRSLSDSLSQEMELYASSNPTEPRVRIHTIFPATILTESYEAENLIKSDMTKKLEELDDGQTAEQVARRSISSLEAGQELVTTDMLTKLVLTSVMGGSVRGGAVKGFVIWIVGCVISAVMVFVRRAHDHTIRSWGRDHGPSGMKSSRTD